MCESHIKEGEDFRTQLLFWKLVLLLHLAAISFMLCSPLTKVENVGPNLVERTAVVTKPQSSCSIFKQKPW